MKLLALADDATGALEAGGELARHREPSRNPVRVWFGDAPPPSEFLQGPAGVVINTRSRHLTPEEAEAHVRRMPFDGAARVFKKTDSTLRGNIAAEFRALLHTYPGRPIVYAPAFPDQGRTVSGGELFVHGKRLAETAFASDPLNPTGSGCIPELVAACGVPVAVVPQPGLLVAALDRFKDGAILVCDGRENTDLAEVAAVLRGSRVDAIAAGASAFAGCWAEESSSPVETKLPATRKCLVVNGSLHPRSRSQVEWAAAAGWRVVSWANGNVSADDTGWTVLTTETTRQDDPLNVARRVGITIRQALGAGDYDTLVVFGGDTLDEILRALGCQSVDSVGRLMPGIPVSRIEFGGRTIMLITKAGGFGGENVLGLMRERLEKSE